MHFEVTASSFPVAAGSQDYTATSGTYTLSVSNNGLASVTIPLTNDGDSEGPEEFFANLATMGHTASRTTLDPAAATASILDDDGMEVQRQL